MSRGILFDTCAVIWLAQDDPLDSDAEEKIERCFDSGGDLLVSPISAWEMGMLMARGRVPLKLEPKEWFRGFLQRGLAKTVPLTPETLIDSSFLPGSPPRDPSDRIIIATARMLDLAVMTRDSEILDYAEAGYVNAIPC